MNYIVYKTTNKKNNKIYIGVHKQEGEDFDGYLGSGSHLNRSINKNGRENFYRETLYTFNTPEEAYKKEKDIVNLDFLKRKDVYNKTLGGFGSFEHTRSKEVREKVKKINLEKYGVISSFGFPEVIAKTLKTRKEKYGSVVGKMHNKEAREKAEASRCLKHKVKGINRNHYLMTEEAIKKAKVTRVLNTRERSINKYPELNKKLTLVDKNGKVCFVGIMYDMNIFMFGQSKGSSGRKVLNALLSGEKELTYRSKWYGFKIIEDSSETISSESKAQVGRNIEDLK